jgi:hypothetical protein
MGLPDGVLVDVVRKLGLDVFGQQNPRRQLETHEWMGP